MSCVTLHLSHVTNANSHRPSPTMHYAAKNLLKVKANKKTIKLCKFSNLLFEQKSPVNAVFGLVGGNKLPQKQQTEEHRDCNTDQILNIAETDCCKVLRTLAPKNIFALQFEDQITSGCLAFTSYLEEKMRVWIQTMEQRYKEELSWTRAWCLTNRATHSS